MRLRAFVALASLLSSLAPSLVLADNNPWLLAPREFYSELEAERFSSDTYHDVSSGDRLDLGGTYEQRTLRLTEEFGWKKTVDFGLSMPVTSATRTLGDPATQTFTSTGFGDIDVIFKFKIRSGRSPATGQVSWTAPLGYSTEVPVPLGLGQQHFDGRLLAGASLPQFNAWFDGNAGYRYWYQQFANQFLASARAGVWIGSSFLAIGHYDGVVAVGEGDTPNDEFSRQEFGPELRYRVDDRVDVYAGSRHTLSGKGVLHQNEFYVGMAFRQTTLDRLQGILGNKQRP